MARKHTIDIDRFSYGVYDGWDPESREIPSLKAITHTIPAQVGIEFGMVLHIRKGRGMTMEFTIEHPPFADSKGDISPVFAGEQFISSNDYRFFIGDTVWEPVHDKIGTWTICCRINGEIIAQESFKLVEA